MVVHPDFNEIDGVLLTAFPGGHKGLAEGPFCFVNCFFMGEFASRRSFSNLHLHRAAFIPQRLHDFTGVLTGCSMKSAKAKRQAPAALQAVADVVNVMEAQMHGGNPR